MGGGGGELQLFKKCMKIKMLKRKKNFAIYSLVIDWLGLINIGRSTKKLLFKQIAIYNAWIIWIWHDSFLMLF